MLTAKKGLTSNQIKLIAIAAMTVDHLAWVIFPGYSAKPLVLSLHIIGRITAPIMWFFVAEGAFYTRDIKRYFLRLVLFAAVSHFAYCFAFGHPYWGAEAGIFNRTSVLWPLALAVLIIAVCREEKYPSWLKFAVIVLGCLLSFPSDWSTVAAMTPMFLYFYRGDFKKQALIIIVFSAVYALVFYFFMDRLYALVQLCTFLSVPILAGYNGERGSFRGMKWLFYIYYPAHLFLVGLVRLMLGGS